MATLSVEATRGLEYDWLAVDAIGHVGFFSTAGAGRAPRALLEDAPGYERAIDLLLGGDPVTDAAFFPTVRSGLTNAWRLAAERGVFAFDASPVDPTYRLVAAPRLPIRSEHLPEFVYTVAHRVALKAVEFGGNEGAPIEPFA